MALYSVLLACFMALLVLLYNVSSTVRYYIKFTYFIIACAISATIPMPLMLRKVGSPENALIPAWLCLRVARSMGLTWEVRGIENIDNTKGNIVLMNHQSFIDLFTLAALWPLMKNSTVISKRMLFYLWPFGLATWLWGTVFIDRSRKQQAHDTVNQTVDAIVQRKAKILLFPEGTRNGASKLIPFKKGAFHAALDAHCPIQPVVISNYYFLDSKRPKFSPGHFIIKILPLIPTTGLTKADLPELVESCQTLMQETYYQVSSEAIQHEHNNNVPLSKFKS